MTPGTAAETATRWITNPRWEGDGVLIHGMTTRHFAPPDMPRPEFARLVREGLGVPEAVSVLMKQVHGRRAAWVDAEAAKRAEDHVLRIPDVDAVVTDAPGVLIHVSVADCVPVLAFERRRRIIGGAHAGWRGTVQRVAARLVREMATHGADPDQMEVWLGPSIGPCCFQVGEDVLRRFTAVLNWWPGINLGERSVDLATINRLQLARVGVHPQRMTTNPLCTRCNVEQLHSHRAEPDNRGRMHAVIGLRV